MKYQLRSVEDRYVLEKIFKISKLNSGQLFIKDYDVRFFLEAFYIFLYFIYFSGAYEGFRIYLLKVDDEPSAYFGSSCLSQKFQLVDGRFRLVNAVIFKCLFDSGRIYGNPYYYGFFSNVIIDMLSSFLKYFDLFMLFLI